MRFIRSTSAALLSLLLAVVIDGSLLLACPALFGGVEACDHCSRTQKSHCPLAPGQQACPLESPGQLAAEFVPAAADAMPEMPHRLPWAARLAAPLTQADDWHHQPGLYLRLQILRN